MKLLRWIGLVIVAAVAVVLFLDTFGGYLLDGPLGPIPGGAFEGPVNPESEPDWSQTEEVIELEIRPDKPWSLSVWNTVIDGELYIPSAYGETRRWPKVALADPRVRVRTGGQIYERRIEKVEAGPTRTQAIQQLAERYDFEPPPEGDDSTWIFHLGPRS